MNPAVGRGIGSHLLSPASAALAPREAVPPSAASQPEEAGPHPAPARAEVVPIGAALNLSTVDTFNSPAAAKLDAPVWVTESGEGVPAARVRPIRTLDDVLNEAEQAVYTAMRSHGAGGAGDESLIEIGYDQLARQSGVTRKTIQRVVAKLVQKDAICIERSADIFSRRPTLYRVFPAETAVRRMASRQRSHIAKIGPGFVFVRRNDNLNLSTVDRLNMSTVNRSERGWPKPER